MNNKTAVVIAIVVAALIVVGGWFWYADTAKAPTQTPTQTQNTASNTLQTGLANPASVNCVTALKGQLEIQDAQGGQVGICHLPDGRACEEWDLLRNGTCSTADAAADYKNGTYFINKQAVTLVGGRASTSAAPGSASLVVTQYFGNESTGDLNGDGKPDTAFILVQDEGGSGTFYYVAAALKTANGYKGTNAVLLGDRVAPQPTQIQNGEVIANYAERKAGEPMTAKPSVGVSKYLHIVAGRLVEVANPNQ